MLAQKTLVCIVQWATQCRSKAGSQKIFQMVQIGSLKSSDRAPSSCLVSSPPQYHDNNYTLCLVLISICMVAPKFTIATND